MALLEAENISKKYGQETILGNINLHIEAAEMTAITGKSGCGKTTLLSLLGFLQKPSAGEIRIHGNTTTGLTPAEYCRLRRENMGFVFQRARLDGALNVLENVLLPMWLFHGGKELEKRAKTLLKELGLEHRIRYAPAQLSVGQLRRVALARALLLQPAILLADEPTNDLDEESAEIVFHTLQRACDHGAAVVLVTHDKSYANRADRVLELQQKMLSPIAVGGFV